MAEPWIVVPVVVGSSPISHPQITLPLWQGYFLLMKPLAHNFIWFAIPWENEI